MCKIQGVTLGIKDLYDRGLSPVILGCRADE